MNRMRRSGVNTKNANEKPKDSNAAGVENPGFIPILPKRNSPSKHKHVVITTASSQNDVRIASISRVVKRHTRKLKSLSYL